MSTKEEKDKYTLEMSQECDLGHRLELFLPQIISWGRSTGSNGWILVIFCLLT